MSLSRSPFPRRSLSRLGRLAELGRASSLLSRGRIVVLTDEADLAESYALRGRVFGASLRWVSLDERGQDSDGYDDGATHIGLAVAGRLLGSVRLVRRPSPWMLDRDFAPLLQGARIGQGRDSAEISRLAVEPALCGTLRGALVRALLCRAITRWALGHRVRYLYAVVTCAFATSLQRRYGFEPIGVPWRFGDGPLTTAVRCDIEQASEALAVEAPLRRLWLQGPGPARRSSSRACGGALPAPAPYSIPPR